ncbi:unnamed protein product [Closterium sp. NIES-65]|nr:unnamed protein product [Closterium sp. NIES-65]
MYPVLCVWNTSKVMSLNVNYRLPVTENSPNCTTVPELGKAVTCPAISIHRSYGVKIGKRAPLTGHRSGKGGQGSGRAGQGVAELGKGVAELGKGVAELGKDPSPPHGTVFGPIYVVRRTGTRQDSQKFCCLDSSGGRGAPHLSTCLHSHPHSLSFSSPHSTVFGPVGVQWSMAMPRAAGLTNAHWSVFSLFFSSHTSSQAPACLQATPYPVYLSPPQGNIFGRVDVLRSMDMCLDSLSVTGVASFIRSPGMIRVALCGYGPGLLKSNIVISNNEVYGEGAVGTAITNNNIHGYIFSSPCSFLLFPLIHSLLFPCLQGRAVGVTVRNNYVHHFIFAGIKCGADVHYSFACMLSRINSNLVVSSGRNLNGDHDSAGIYFYTHWFSPGNSALCNYVFNGDHCYYLDHCTSGVLVRGGACVNTYDGMKVNNGKRNVIKNVVMKGTRRSLGWTSCFTVTVNNCLKDPGNYSEAMRVKYYNSARINHVTMAFDEGRLQGNIGQWRRVM